MFIFTLLISVGVIFFIADLGYEGEYREFFADVNELVDRGGVYSVILFISLCTFITIFVFWFPLWPFAVMGGALFGPFFGAFYTVIGMTLGAVASFKILRYIEGGYLARFVSERTRWIQRFFHSTGDNGFVVVLTLRLIHFVPFRGVNYTAGIMPISFRDFFLGTFLGIIPANAFYAYLGDSLAELDLSKIILAIIIAVLFSFLIYSQQEKILFWRKEKEETNSLEK